MFWSGPSQSISQSETGSYMGGDPPDLVLHVGDIAYPWGTIANYTKDTRLDLWSPATQKQWKECNTIAKIALKITKKPSEFLYKRAVEKV